MRMFVGFAVAAVILAAISISRADDQPELQALIAKAIKAHGGAAKLGKFKASIVKMKLAIKFAGRTDMLVTTWRQGPDRMKTETELQIDGNNIRRLAVVNRDKGWTKANGMVMEMTQSQIAKEKEGSYASWSATSLLPLLDKGYQLSSAAPCMVNDKGAFGLLVKHKERKDLTLYFDKKTGLLVKSETRLRPLPGQKESPLAESFYGDYKEFAGIPRATSIRVGMLGKIVIETIITDYQALEKLDDGIFAKP